MDKHGDNPFTACFADGPVVKSDYWHLKAQDNRTAQRFAEVIKAAYEAGRRDKSAEIRNVLIGPDVGDDFYAS